MGGVEPLSTPSTTLHVIGVFDSKVMNTKPRWMDYI